MTTPPDAAGGGMLADPLSHSADVPPTSPVPGPSGARQLRRLIAAGIVASVAAVFLSVSGAAAAPSGKPSLVPSRISQAEPPFSFTLDAAAHIRRLAGIVTGTIAIDGPSTTVTLAAGDDANITFSGTQGQHLGIALSNVTIGTSACCSAFVSVIGPSGNVMPISAFGTDGGSRNVPTLPSTDTYTIVIDPQGTAAGSVTLTLSEDTTNTIAIDGVTSTVTTSRMGQNARLTFTGTQGQHLGFEASNVSLGTSTCCGGNVSVLRSDDTPLTNGRAVGTDGGNFNLPPLPYTGSYTLFVDPAALETGSVTLTLSEDVASSITIGGSTSSVTMSRIGQNGRVTFSGVQGQYLGLALSNVTLAGANVSVLRDDESLLTLGRSVGTNGGTMDIPKLPYTGSYTIFVDPATLVTGALTLTLSEDVASTVTIGGASTTVNIARIGQNARVTFPGPAPALVLSLTNVTLGTSACCSGFVSVLNPDASALKQITSFGTNGAIVSVPASSQSGTYTIFLDPNAADLSTGSVTVTLSQVTSAAQTYGVCGGSGAHALTAAVCTADPVNSLTGAFTTSGSDLSLASKGLSFSFGRSYTSADSTSGRLGPGWTDNYAVSLTIQPNGDVLLHGDEGQQLSFTKQADGSFVGAPGALSTLALVGGSYKLVRHDQVTYTFNAAGVLQSELDRNGQGLSFGYDGSGRLSTVTDASGHTVTFGYSGASTLLSSIGSTAQNTVSYGYTGGRLTSVTLPDPDGVGPLAQPVTHYTYDAGGRLATIVDANNHTQVTNVYDPTSGRVTQQTDANNKTTTFAWDDQTQTATATDANNHVWKDVYQNNILIKRIDAANKTTLFDHDNRLDISAVTSPDGSSKTTMVYDAAGNLLSATAPASLGSVQKVFTYDAQNNVKTVTDARNKQTVYGYTGGNLTSVTLDGQPVAAATYNAQGQILTSSDGNGKTTTYTYDANGNVASVLAPDPDGAGPLFIKTTYTYDSMGNVLTRIDPLGNCTGCTAANYTTTYTYDAEGHLLTEKDQLGNITTHTYDLAGNETSVKDANNHTTTYEYDSNNRLTKTTGPDPDGAGAQTAPITTYSYDSVGNRATEVNPRGNVPGGNPAAYTTSYSYDPNNRLISVTTPKNEKTTYTYDTNGNRDSVVDPRGNVQGANPNDYKTTYAYDAAGRLLSTTDPLTHVTTNHYDAVGNLDWTKDANNHQTSYTYDAAGRILTVTAPDLGVTTYTYDGNGNLKTRKDDNQHTTSYSYDDPGRLVQTTGQDPDGAGAQTAPVTTYTYDVNGNRLTMIDPNGNATATPTTDGKTTYTYDRVNRLKTTAYSDTTPGVTYNYDPVGNKTSMVDGSGTLTYIYDALDRLTSATRGTNAFSYTYDPAGNVLSRTYPDTTQTSYTYDEDNRLATAASGANTSSYAYDPASNLVTTTLPASNGYVETRNYDKAGRLTEVKNAQGPNTLSDFASTLDPVGNPTQITQTGAVTSTTTYGYDANDRLTSVCFQAGTCPGGTDPFVRWGYDKVGNRLTEQRPTGTTNYIYNARDQVTQAGSTTYTYNQNGNETTAGSRSFTYDLANRLKTTTSGSTTTTYTYDGDDNRLQASTGTQASSKTNFLWDTNHDLPLLAIERDGNNVLLRRYLYGIGRISMRSGSTDYYYHYDSLGSVRNVTSAAGIPQWTDTYEPFGAIRTETKNDPTAPANPMKFTGEYLDQTGFYYLRARQYDASTGRFLQEDPLQSAESEIYTSTYAYAGDRPGVMADPTGETFGPINVGQLAAWSTTSICGTLVRRSPVIGERSFAAAKGPLLRPDMHGPPGYPEPAPSSTSKPVAGLIAGLFEFLDYFNFPRPGRGVNSIKLENTGNPGEGFILREVGTSSKTEGRQNVIRIMATKQRRYPNGYLRYTNSKGEYINPRTGSTGTEAETHIEPSYRGPFRGLPKFWTGK